MGSKEDTHRRWLRGGLLFVAATPLAGGLWALLLPRVFYEDFPLPGREWVSTLGPYNEHLIRDYGALNLALAVLLVSAAIDRKSTRLNSSHANISYAVFCLKKKNNHYK